MAEISDAKGKLLQATAALAPKNKGLIADIAEMRKWP